MAAKRKPKTATLRRTMGPVLEMLPELQKSKADLSDLHMMILTSEEADSHFHQAIADSGEHERSFDSGRREGMKRLVEASKLIDDASTERQRVKGIKAFAKALRELRAGWVKF